MLSIFRFPQNLKKKTKNSPEIIQILRYPLTVIRSKISLVISPKIGDRYEKFHLAPSFVIRRETCPWPRAACTQGHLSKKNAANFALLRSSIRGGRYAIRTQHETYKSPQNVTFRQLDALSAPWLELSQWIRLLSPLSPIVNFLSCIQGFRNNSSKFWDFSPNPRIPQSQHHRRQ